jgi:predicted negative regulator of RcsB-dependent stress response
MKEKELDNQHENEEEIFDDGAEFVEEYEEQNSLLQNKYLRYGLIGAVAVLVIAGGWIGYSYYQDNAQQEASLKLARIRPYFDQGYYNEALNGLSGATMRGARLVGLRNIADDYGTTETGKLAALYAATALFAMNDIPTAERYFNQASAASASITRVGGLAGMAACRAKSGNNEGAAKLYEDAAKESEKISDDERYRLFAALHYEKAGKKDEALAIFKRIAASQEFSEIVHEAKAGVVRLGGTVQ